jgi:predicted ester cyclase
MTTEANKELVRRLVEAVNRRDLDELDHVAAGEFASAARRWISPFQGSFPDFKMRIVDLIAEDDKVVAHFKCSGTHQADWLGIAATQNRFEEVDEVYIFRVENGRLVGATGIEDNLSRMHQLGFRVEGPGGRGSRAIS